MHALADVMMHPYAAGFFRSPPSLITLILALVLYAEGYWACRSSYAGWGFYLQFAAELGCLGLGVESALYGRYALSALALILFVLGVWLMWRLYSKTHPAAKR